MATGLKIIGGPDRGAFFELPQGTFTIGREPENAIQLDSQMVSRQHAEIYISRDQVLVRDLASANGTMVNHRRIEEHVLLPGDRLFIGEFILELVGDPKGLTQQSRGETVSEIVNHANAPRMSGGGPEASPGLLPQIDWKIKLLVILSVVLLVDHLVVAQLFSKKIHSDITEAAVKRARDITRFLAEKNKEDLRDGHETLLDTDTVMQEEGVIAALVANKNGRVLSPTHKVNQILNDETTVAALKSAKQGVFQSPPLAGGIYRFASPIRVYRETGGYYETIGVAIVFFSPQGVSSTMQAVKKIWLISLGFVPLITLLLFFIVRRITLPPISYLAEKIALLFRGEVERIERKTPIQALAPLIDTVNAAAVRIKDGSFDSLSFPQQIDNKGLLANEEQLKWLLTTLSDAVVILNGSGTILALNQKAASLLEVEDGDLIGRHFQEVITDRIFKEFLDGCMNELQEKSELVVVKTLEYGDFAYQFALHGWGDATDRLQYVAIVVEKL